MEKFNTEAQRHGAGRPMKDSGVAWIGAVPEGWGVVHLYALANQVKCPNDGCVERNLLSLSYGKIKRKNIDAIGGLTPESYDTYNRIERDDVVLRLTDLQNDHTSIRVARSFEKGIVTSAYVTIRAIDRVSAGYLHYGILAFDLIKGLYGLGSGVRQGLNYNEVKRLRFMLPPLPEQRAIAGYLDGACGKIDGLREKVEKQIAALEEYKKSVITEAVTGKVEIKVRSKKEEGRSEEWATFEVRERDPKTMKPSGVAWIGDVPEGWGVMAIKYLCTMQAGDNLKTNDIDDDGAFPVYGGNGRRGFYSDYNIDGDVLLIGRQGALAGNVHHSIGKIWATEHAVVTRANQFILSAYLYYLLTVMDLNQYACNTAAQPGLAVSVIMSKAGICPPLPEQRAIAGYLDRKCAAIDGAVAKCKKQLDNLAEYKKSLIYECVTGKREVGG